MFKKTLISAGIVLVSGMATAADVANSNLQVNFESAHLQGAGNQITMLKVPVINKETGKGDFYDMSATFSVDKQGNLIFNNINTVKSVAFGSANQLIAGHYKDESGCSWFVDGPSAGALGRLSWTIVMPTCNTSNYSAQVLSGSLKGNELASGIKGYKDLIKNEANMNYGLLDGNRIIGVAQAGQFISITNYYAGRPDRTWSLMPAPKVVAE